MAPDRLRRVIRGTSITQIALAVLWAFLLAGNPSPRFGTIVNLIGLMVAGILGVRAASLKGSPRFVVGLNWVLVLLWSIGLVWTVVRAVASPAIAANLLLLVTLTLAIIVPCLVNAMAVQRLRKGVV